MLRLAFLGIDHPHGAHWRQQLSNFKDQAEIVAFVPAFGGGTSSLEEGYAELPRYDSVVALVKEAQFDAAVVCLSNREGPGAIVELAQAGKHVLAEKPVAAAATDAQKITEAVGKAGIAFQTGYMWRYDEIANRLKRMVAQGAFGQLISVEMTFVTSDIARRGPDHYLFDPQVSGAGFFSWLACHWLDTLFYVTGRAVVGVTARTGVFGSVPTAVEDGGVAILDLEGGGIATFLGGYWHPRWAGESRWAIRGSQRWIHWDAARKGTNGVLEIHGPQPQWHAMEDVYSLPEDKSPGYGGQRGFLLVEDWLDCIRTGRRDMRNSAGSMVATLELIDAIFQSSREGRGSIAGLVPIERRKLNVAGLYRACLLRFLSPSCFVSFVFSRLLALLAMSRLNLLVFSLCFISIDVFAADWPQFRGPASDGTAQSPAPLPTDIGPEKHVLWKTELPPGHSSPAIVGNKIFVTAVADKERLETIALDRASGKILWRAEAPHKSLEKIHSIGSYAQPSPAADEERVVSMFGSSGLYCYEHTGKELWHVEMGPFNDEFGAAASPIIADDRVLVAQDHDTDSFLAAYDKRTGKQLWRTDRGEFSRGYCTPVIWEVNGQKQIVVSGTLRVAGYDWNTGAEVWTVRGLSRVVCITPVVGDGNMLYAAGWSAGGEPGDSVRLEPFADYTFQYDENKNGTVEKTEIGNSAALKTRFAQCDRDKDGHITQKEYEDFRNLFDKSQNGVLAIKPGGKGDVTETHTAWRFDKFAPFCASPLAYQGHVFVIKDGGILTCLNAATGQATKSGRVMGTGNYYASPTAGDGKVYLLSQRGTLSVVEAAPQWKVIHSAEFGEECYASPALVDGRIYLRTSGYLYCFGAEKAL